MSEAFNRALLSAREDAILTEAIEGATDMQIALKLDISPSTVNSYWVRIRGKLGQLSRTELVSIALRQQAKQELDAALARCAEYERLLAERHTLTEDYGNAERHRAALDGLPEAVLVTDSRGNIVYTNDRLDAIFHYRKGELAGRHVTVLVPPRVRERERQALDAHLVAPHARSIGIDKCIYGLTAEGREIRVTLLLDTRPTSDGDISICLVRDFADEIDVRRRHARASAESVLADDASP